VWAGEKSLQSQWQFAVPTFSKPSNILILLRMQAHKPLKI